MLVWSDIPYEKLTQYQVMLQQVSLNENDRQPNATSWKFDVGKYHDGIGKKLSCLHVKVFETEVWCRYQWGWHLLDSCKASETLRQAREASG